MSVISMLLYSSVCLMVLTVLSNRYWRRPIARARKTIERLNSESNDLTKDLRDAAQECVSMRDQFAEAERRAVRMEQEADRYEAELAVMQDAAVERYYIFDRVEPHSNRFWEAAVRRSADARPAGGGGPSQSWSGVRRYLLVADTELAARERVGARFSARAGYDVVEVVPCRLGALATPTAGAGGRAREHAKDDGTAETAAGVA